MQNGNNGGSETTLHIVGINPLYRLLQMLSLHPHQKDKS